MSFLRSPTSDDFQIPKFFEDIKTRSLECPPWIVIGYKGKN